MKTVVALAWVALLFGLPAQDRSMPARATGWQIDLPTDGWDPSLRAALHLAATEQRGGAMGGEAVRLLLLCRDEGMSGLILWSQSRDSMWLNSGYDRRSEKVAVSVRFDDGPLETTHWSLSDDQRGTIVPAADLPGLIQRLDSAERITASTGKIRVTFYPRGVRQALAALGDRCAPGD